MSGWIFAIGRARVVDMKCLVCGSEMTKKKIPVDLRIGDKLLVVEQVPATVCDHCGEKVFAPTIATKLQALGKHRSNAQRTLRVPVFSMDKVSPSRAS